MPATAHQATFGASDVQVSQNDELILYTNSIQ